MWHGRPRVSAPRRSPLGPRFAGSGRFLRFMGLLFIASALALVGYLWWNVWGTATPPGQRRTTSDRRSNATLGIYLRLSVGAGGFEPPASCSQSRRAATLRYAPWDGC